MCYYNQTGLAGNLTRDPEFKTSPNGVSYCTFAIASSRKGGDTEKVLFMDCVAFGKLAEMISRHYLKGNGCIVHGELQMDEWEDKTTKQRRTKIKLVVNSASLTGSPKAEGGAEGDDGTEEREPAMSAPSGSTRRAPGGAPRNPDEGEDVPF